KLILTGADTQDLGDLPCGAAIPDVTVAMPPYPILAHEEVRHVGDAVAFVVAETLERARDAAEAIAIEWEPLPHVIGAEAALAPGAPPLWPNIRGNLAFEAPLAAVAARRLGRPVKWIAERSEHFLGDTQGRDNITRLKLALDEDARILALEVDIIADMGAYLSAYAPFIPYLGAGMAPGVYDIPACHVRVRGAFTNTVPVDAYRGAGRPEAAYLIERLVDVAARELGIAPDELRRRNFIAPTAMPDTTPTAKAY